MTTKIRVKHFHDGNDPDHKTRGPASYATMARLYDLSTGQILGEAWAYCSPRDAASRAKGREIAVGRLERKLKIGRFAPKTPNIVKHALSEIGRAAKAKFLGTAL